MLNYDGWWDLAEHNRAPAPLSMVRLSVSEKPMAQDCLKAPVQHQLSGIT